MNDEQLSALLRFKRHEKPPAGYFERLLLDVHRGQRTELLRRPLWKIGVERLQVVFSEHSMGQLSYAGAMAVALVLGIIAIKVATPSAPSAANQIAKTESHGAAPTPPPSFITLDRSPEVALDPPYASRAPAAPATLVSAPRYVIDARPVSYEPSSSLSF